MAKPGSQTDRIPSLNSNASLELLAWNQSKVRAQSMNLIKPKYSQRDPSTKEEVYNVRKTLTFCMKAAIKKSVDDQAYNSRRELTPEDFVQEKKIRFDPNDPVNIIEKPFKFTDYAPVVFKALRQNFGIDEKEYLESLTETELDNFQSTSKSGCFFFFSGDGQYLIKGTTQQEAKFFLQILQDYTGHMRRSVNSLLVRFCGLYRIKVPHIRKRTHFIVMRSVYSESQFHPCHVVYDLKGSTAGRASKEGSHVKKDVDFIEERINTGKKINFGTQKDRNAFISYLKNDVVWLQKNNIMDYSLLVGIHDKDQSTMRAKVMNYKSGRFEDLDIKALEQQRQQRSNEGRKRKTTLSRFSVINAGGEKRETYYIAIIDILQPYNAKKWAENLLKTLYLDSESISAIPSKAYGERFFDFILEATTSDSPSDESLYVPETRNKKKKSAPSKSKDRIFNVI